MKFKNLLLISGLVLGAFANAFGQAPLCPAPIPGAANCYQTSRPNNGNPLTNWPPAPNQDCCNAVPLCNPLNFIDNGVIVPEGAPAGVLFPGCVQDELPPAANTCFSNNEKATTWYKWQIRPLQGGPTAPGSPAGKLRFKIIPLDALDDPNYDPFTDLGAVGYGETDYDFLLFKIPANVAGNDGAACLAIKNSTIITNNNTVIASCNWTGVRGPTGLFEPGTGTAAAQGPAVRFNKPLDVKVGDIFYLAIDNFSVNQQGFYVDFRGLEAPDDSTAIVNPPPADNIKFANIKNPECASKQFVMTFTAPVRCDSVRPEKFSVTGLNPPYVITSITPQGGCNPGGQDTSFVFTISPDLPDTTLQIIVVNEIKDICGNSVIKDTINIRLNYPIPLRMNLIADQASCGITKLNIQFANKVFCDSVKANKFRIIRMTGPVSAEDFGAVATVERTNGLPCTAGTLDSLYTVTFNKAIIDTSNLRLVLSNIIRDKCGNPVEFDTLAFKINPFLKLLADTNKACPKVPIILSAKLDSTFNTVPNQLLEYEWKNLADGQFLVDGDSVVFLNDFKTRVRLTRDNFFPQLANYRLYVRHSLNSCVDSADIQVLFAAKPNVEQFNPAAYCFGDTLTITPTISNGTKNQLEYSWTRKPTNSVISTDSVLGLRVNEDLLATGTSQTYSLKVKFTPEFGGCANTTAFDANLKFGKKIMPKIALDSAFRFASILPADFIFGNQTTFFPAKTGGQYLWDFGNNETRTVQGTGEVLTTYTEPGTYVIKLTAFDSVFAVLTAEPKICSATDQIEIGAQDLVPSLVTANGDGVNDNFYIKGMRPNTFTMKLYDRWGKKVGEQDPFKVDVQEESRGGMDVKDLGPGIYYYILTEIRSGKNLVGWISITKDKL